MSERVKILLTELLYLFRPTPPVGSGGGVQRHPDVLFCEHIPTVAEVRAVVGDPIAEWP